MGRERVFDIGIALAGGSTRGAYSAGVMDFLLQALDEWEKRRVSVDITLRKALPPWFVRLKTLAGTSAGGITAAVATASVCTPYEHLSNKYEAGDRWPRNNNLFKVWVMDVTLEGLFSTDDLDPEKGRRDAASAVPVRSLLNAYFMPQTAAGALAAESTSLPKPLWADQLELYITTSNLRGVPYHVENFQGQSKELSDFRMTRHHDWVGFKTCDSCSRKGLFALDLAATRNASAWNRVRDAAQGTATLPLIFPVKAISSPRRMYDEKLPWGTPDWPSGMPSQFVYDAVDGGVFMNEPMELVRASMEHGQEKEVLADNAEDARGAMILLHPSPKRAAYGITYPSKNRNMLSILTRTFGALMEEANFQDEELAAMADEDNISRFLVAPVRAGRQEGQPVLATDTIHGFGGIVDEAVRLHDFQLGRRNCQKFLLDYFVVPLEKARQNPIFSEDSERFAKVLKDGRKVVPIIPLLGTAEDECPLPQWPMFTPQKRAALATKLHEFIEKRVNAVVKSFAVNLGFYKDGFRFGANFMWNFIVDRLVNLAASHIIDMADNETREALDQFS